MIIRNVFLLATFCYVALLFGADKHSMTAKVTVIKEEEKDAGYIVAIEKDTVKINSVNGTIIDFVLPRIGKYADGIARPRDFAAEAKIKYPLTSPEWTDAFMWFMWRAQHVRDDGHLPTKAEMDAEWRTDHPEERLK
jgi:hypothetical protein